MSKVTVTVDPKDAQNIVDIDLTRDECESIYALCHVLGHAMGDRGEMIESGMAAVLKEVPKGVADLLTVPFTADAAISVLSLCCFANATKPTGQQRVWVDPVVMRISQSLRDARTRGSIAIDGKPVFSSP